MDWDFLVRILASILAESAPLVIACLGETLTERAGVINLSLDGTILLSAMTAFVAASLSGSLALGFCSAAAVGALLALIVVVASIDLRQDQVAVGFVLSLLATDLSSFLGNPYVRKPGPAVPPLPIPVLKDVPVLGPLLFNHNLVTYASFALIGLAWFWMYRTRPGLEMQASGEHPAAAFARGVPVNRLRLLYALFGGALAGIAGASYSLSIKVGWSYQHTLGIGWIALAIVIFGGWDPLRVAFGTYLFGALQSMGSLLQGVLPGVPTQAFQVAPFVLMIGVLVLVRSEGLERFLGLLEGRAGKSLAGFLRVTPPSALGRRFEQE
jgi:general nucleoside transport system permease protein